MGHSSGSNMFTFCNCQGDACNKDWSTAAGPPVKCYNCNSMSGTCSGEDPGALEECPIQKRKGCYISKASYGTDTTFERGCTDVSDPAEYVCQDLGKQGQGLHYCNCVGNACNENWSTAGNGATGDATTIVISSIGIVGMIGLHFL